MPIISWASTDAEKKYQTGIDRVALYKKFTEKNYDTTATYTFGDVVVSNGKLYRCKVAATTAGEFSAADWDYIHEYTSATDKDLFLLVAAWDGVTALNENPSGAEVTKQYADNIHYFSLVSKEEFALTLEAFYSPEEFDECDGSATNLPNGMIIHGQSRAQFALVYRVLKGDNAHTAGYQNMYEYHIVYNCRSSVAGRDNSTINDSPEAGSFSWEISTIKPGAADMPSGFEPTAHFYIDAEGLTTGAGSQLEKLENYLFGATYSDGEIATVTGKLPLPKNFAQMFV